MSTANAHDEVDDEGRPVNPVLVYVGEDADGRRTFTVTVQFWHDLGVLTAAAERPLSWPREDVAGAIRRLSAIVLQKRYP